MGSGPSQTVELYGFGMNRTLGFEFPVVERGRVEAEMPVTDKVRQPFGFVHGGATIALLEAAASLGSTELADLENELPFGVEVSIRHRSSAREGTVRAVAVLDRIEPNRGRAGGVKHYWNVTAKSDSGAVMSEGFVMVKVVPKANLGQTD